MAHLLFDTRDGVATITLNRPDKLNAFTDGMLADWRAALATCEADDTIRAVVLTGAGRAFCTGGDLDALERGAGDSPAEIKAELTDRVQPIPRALATLGKPVIAALNGVATGGGLDVALACDIRFAAQSARFAETYLRMGLIPGVGGAFLLPRIVGIGKAMELFLSAEFIDAAEAERIGLINRVCPDATLLDEAQDFARRIAEAPPLSVRLIKRMIRMGLDTDLDGGLEMAAANLPVARGSEDHREALAAFREKRKPVFKGR